MVVILLTRAECYGSYHLSQISDQNCSDYTKISKLDILFRLNKNKHKPVDLRKVNRRKLIVHWENGNIVSVKLFKTEKAKSSSICNLYFNIARPSETTPYLLSLPQHIQIKETIINTTNTPPNVIKNIPNEVSCAAVGESLCGGSVVKSISCLVGVTTTVMLANEWVEYFVRSGWILSWFV